MSSELLIDLLLASSVIALSPIPIIAITLVLGTPQARPNGLAFAAGWVAGLLAITAVFVVLADGAEEQVDGANTALDAIRLAVGVLLLVLAARTWMKRPRNDEDVKLPGWMSSIDQITPWRALVAGLALAAANPKNIAFSLVAAASIAGSGAVGTEEWIAVLVFVALGSLTVVGSVIFYLLATDRATGVLAKLKDFMARNNALIMAALFAFFGVKLLIEGISGLVA